MKILKPLLFLFFLNLSACAVGPLVSHETARTVGDGKTELVAAYGSPGLALKATHGMSENFDLGIHIESLNRGLRAKYAILNASQGLSVAGAFGYGLSFGGRYMTEDITVSYLNHEWEPYGTLRLSQVSIDDADVEDANTHEHLFKIKGGSFSYGQFIVGTC